MMATGGRESARPSSLSSRAGKGRREEERGRVSLFLDSNQREFDESERKANELEKKVIFLMDQLEDQRKKANEELFQWEIAFKSPSIDSRWARPRFVTTVLLSVLFSLLSMAEAPIRRYSPIIPTMAATSEIDGRRRRGSSFDGSECGKPYTLSIAIPGSFLLNAQSAELRTYMAGQGILLSDVRTDFPPWVVVDVSGVSRRPSIL
ncbi:hypothetical protein PMAYCL1PPCAC_00148, partial [Pristionchus mayeri]